MIDIRTVHPTDLGFILHSWLRSYKSLSFVVRRVRDDCFYKNHQLIVKDILKNDSTEVIVAHLKDEPDIIIGYLVYGKGDVIHYLYVKSEFRTHGVAKQLVHASKVDLNHTSFSHWTEPMDELIVKYPTLIYDPYRR